MLSYRKWILQTIFIASIIIAIISAINYFVDPLLRTGKNSLGAYFSSEREVKEAEAVKKTHRYNSYLIGSSKVAQIDPDDINRDNLVFFNMAFGAALPEEIYNFIYNYCFNQKFIIIGLDLFMFSETTFPLKEESFKKKPGLSRIQAIAEYIASWDTFKYSYKTVNYYYKGEKQEVRKNGQRWTKDEPIKFEKDTSSEKYRIKINNVFSDLYANFKYSKARIKYLKELKSILDKRHIKYIVFLSPINEYEFAELKKSSCYKYFVQLRKDLNEIFPDFVDFSVSKYSSYIYFFEEDPFHYVPRTGKLIIDEMLKSKLF